MNVRSCDVVRDWIVGPLLILTNENANTTNLLRSRRHVSRRPALPIAPARRRPRRCAVPAGPDMGRESKWTANNSMIGMLSLSFTRAPPLT